MRTGAIFARGSCRALKWMALFGVVFALGAGSATAQVKVSAVKTVDEGGRLTFTVTPEISVPADNDGTTNLVVTATPAFADEAQVDAAKLQTVAEAPDIALTAATATWDVKPNTSNTEADDRTLDAKTISFPLGTDLDAEDERITVTFTVAGTGYFDKGASTGDVTFADNATPQHITIDDADDQEFVWEVTTPKPDEEGPIEVTLTAKPTPDQLEYVTALRVDTTGYSLSPSSWTFDDDVNTADDATDGPMATLRITTPDPDKNRDMDTIMVEATVAGTASSRVPSLSIDVADIHALPMADKISAKAYMDDGEGKASKNEAMSVMEGGDPVHVTVTVDRGTSGYPDGEDLKVSVMADSSQALDYRVDPAEITIDDGTGEKSETFKLWALVDDDVGEENLMLTLTAKGAKADNGPGEVMQMFSIAIEDDTTAKVWVKDGAMDAIYGARSDAAGDNEMINPGESFEIMTDDLFGHLPTVTVAYAASSDNSAVGVSASGEKIMVMPQDMEGTAKITITATATDKASSFDTSQDRSDVAHIMFEVDVVLADVSVMVTPVPMEIMEGGASEITATANRPVAERTKISLSVVGDMDAYKLHNELGENVDGIEIPAGTTEGSVTLTASEDDDYMDETLTVIATGPGIDGSMQFEVMVTDNDEAPVDEPTVSAKSQEQVDAVIATAIVTAAGGPDWIEGGDAAMVDMSMLFNVVDDAAPSYSGMSSDDMTVSASSSGMMLTLSPMAAGMATITVTATDAASGDIATAMADVAVAALPLSVMVSASAESVEEGGSIMVTATANQMVDVNTEVMMMRDGASTASLDDYMLEPPLITIMAGETEGSLTLTAKDDDAVEGMEKLTLHATAGDMSAGSVMVDIADNDMEMTYTLSAEDMNLVEGASAELTATASSAVLMDTEVMVMRDGSSTASDADYTAESIMIMAGETTGTTMVIAVEDNEPDSGTNDNQSEILTLYGMVDGMQTNSVSFYLWDAAVPALPIIAQLLLAAFLAVGGYRRYRRR